jgi:signal recognition particle GTPase
VTAIALTKLDGSAKGGVAIAIAHELGIPVKLVGVGEGVDDLRRSTRTTTPRRSSRSAQRRKPSEGLRAIPRPG